MDKSGILGDAFEQGGAVAKQVVKQVVSAPISGAKTAVNQVVPGLTPTADQALEDSPDNKRNQQQPKPLAQPKSTSSAIKQQVIKPDPQKMVQEQADLAKVRQELHQNYYQDLINPPKPKEEKVADKVERQENEEEEKKFVTQQKNQKEDASLANVKRGTGERIPGAG